MDKQQWIDMVAHLTYCNYMDLVDDGEKWFKDEFNCIFDQMIQDIYFEGFNYDFAATAVINTMDQINWRTHGAS